MTDNTKYRNRAIPVIVLVLISMIVLSTLTIGNVSARNMGTYSCTPQGNGVTKCCAIDLDTAKTWCTYCNNTSPPSGCIPAGEESPKGGENTNPNSGGGVLSNDDSSNTDDSNTGPKIPGGDFHSNDDSSNTDDSNTVDPDKIITGGTFNDGSGSDNSGDSSGGIDSSKINSGAVFNQ